MVTSQSLVHLKKKMDYLWFLVATRVHGLFVGKADIIPYQSCVQKMILGLLLLTLMQSSMMEWIVLVQ